MKKKRHDRRVGMLQPPNCGEFPPLVLCCLNQNQFLSKRPLVLLYYVLALFDISDVPSKLFVYRFESSECAVVETCCHRQGGPLVLSPIRSKSCLHSASKDLVCGVVGREGGTTHRGTVLLTDNSTQSP